MANFFINRPIVSIVISILTLLLGVVALLVGEAQIHV